MRQYSKGQNSVQDRQSRQKAMLRPFSALPVAVTAKVQDLLHLNLHYEPVIQAYVRAKSIVKDQPSTLFYIFITNP